MIIILKYYKPFISSLRGKINISYKIKKIKKINYLDYSKSIFTNLLLKYKNNTIYKKIDFYYLNFKYYKNINKILILNVLYNSNRNNLIYLGIYLNGMLKGYNLYKNISNKIKIFEIISIGIKTNLKIGNSLLLNYIPSIYIISNIEYKNKCKYIKSAGTFGTIINKNNNLIYIKLPSKKIIKLKYYNFATLGQNNNKYYNLINKGKIYNIYKKKIVRGTAKNACDHPHGGGKGKSYIGCKYSMTPWNKNALGYKTVN